MPADLSDRFHRYLVIVLLCGGGAMMGAAWIWDTL
ncbi:hypothetical protein MEME101129_24850 [Methylobacterium mesophilicum]